MASKKTESPMDAKSLNKKTLPQLKTICKKLGIECSGKKVDYIASIISKQSEDDGISEIELPLKKKKSSPLTFVIEVPKASTKTKKKSPAKKAGKCTAKENPLLCDEGDICSAATGKCVKDSDANKKGKSQLLVDGRVIVGTKETIEKLQTILGGVIQTSSDKKNVSKKSPAAKKPAKKSPVKKVAKKSPVAKKPAKKSPVKKVAKKSPVAKKSTKKSPVAKKPAKKSPVAKKPAKKSPVKKVSKKSPAKSSKTCVDKEDPLLCKEGEICSAPSGRCIKDTKINRHGSKNDKAELLVDGRVIVGTMKSIEAIQKVLGGTIKVAEKEKSPAKKSPSPVKKSPKPVKKSPKPVKKSPSPAKKSPKRSPKGKEELSPKKAKSKKSESIPDVEKRLTKLIKEKDSTASSKPGKVQMKEQEIYKTFMDCLSSLSAE